LPKDKAAPRRLGVVVVGQSPRPEIVAELRHVIAPGIGIAVRGALDGMTRAEIDGLTPADGHDALFTRLPSGDAVKISKHAVEERARSVIESLAAEGVTATMMCCTGEFPNLETGAGIVRPSAVLAGIVHGLLPKGRLGLFVPLSEQVGALDDKWRRDGIEITSIPMTPGCPDSEIDQAAARMRAAAPDIVVMDCMSYTHAMKDRVRLTIKVPVILGIAAAAHVLAEIL
jgi:protein AroM